MERIQYKKIKRIDKKCGYQTLNLFILSCVWKKTTGDMLLMMEKTAI